MIYSIDCEMFLIAVRESPDFEGEVIITPGWADFNSFGTVVFIFMIFLSVASIFHVEPNFIK